MGSTGYSNSFFFKPLPTKNTNKQTEMTAAATENSSSTPPNTSKDYYFDSYSHFGIHEEMLKVSKEREWESKAGERDNSSAKAGEKVLNFNSDENRNFSLG